MNRRQMLRAGIGALIGTTAVKVDAVKAVSPVEQVLATIPVHTYKVGTITLRKIKLPDTYSYKQYTICEDGAEVATLTESYRHEYRRGRMKQSAYFSVCSNPDIFAEDGNDSFKYYWLRNILAKPNESIVWASTSTAKKVKTRLDIAKKLYKQAKFNIVYFDAIRSFAISLGKVMDEGAPAVVRISGSKRLPCALKELS